tara:strand:- start:62 stop:1768 length:1707 start_codon:yes stop_codon:yes gene_type:complete
MYPYFSDSTIGINVEYDINFKFYAYLHVLTNSIGIIDSSIIILTHKWDKLSKLHIFHHGTLGMYWLYVLQYSQLGGSVGIYFGMIMGAIYNLIMYIHYSIISAGYKNYTKQLFIYSQLGPLMMVSFHSVISFLNNTEHTIGEYINLYYISILLYLYHNELFFEKTTRKISTYKPLHIRINNKIYDASEFQLIHPGGNVIKFYNCIENDVDATDAFNTFHLRSKHATKHLSRLPVIRTLSKEDYITGNVEFKKLISMWKKKGYFKTKYKFFIVWAMAVFLSTLASYYVMYCGNPIIGGVFVGVAWAQCGFIQHHSGHLGFSGNTKLDIMIQTFYEGLLKGGSARWWRNRHNKHHAMPNSIEHDGDLRTTPFFAWDPVLIRKVPTFLLQIQHLIFIPIMFLYVPVFFVTTKLFIIRKEYWDELAIIFLHFYFSSFFINNIKDFIIFYMIGYSIQGFYLGIMFALNHFAMGRIDNIETTWEKWQMDSTCNWGVGNRYAEVISGFLNIQIEHHIAPQMPAENIHLIVPDIMKYSKDNNIPYINYTFIEAFNKMMNGLKETGQTELKRRKKLK